MIVRKLLFFLVLLLTGCVGMPEGVTPVKNFQLERYLGKWYEIARLDHSFERGLSQISAEYSLNPDGSVKVINRGFSDQEKKWKEAVGKASFVKNPDQGFLKVSFFGPFYGSYIILELDHQNYSYALVCGPDRSYLWMLARSPKIDDATKNALIAKAASLGFKTDELIFVQHD
ncbi:MAG TPA: lipocalin family protein [Smithella sp.]|nr:lipocalin family protein [Smithella sp.]HOU51675.1 lipocalin family protein [Smithella sp.]HQI73151.1 lipocalin family protein [Smithella sp.]